MKIGKFKRFFWAALVILMLPAFMTAAYAKEYSYINDINHTGFLGVSPGAVRRIALGNVVDQTLGSFSDLLFAGQKLEVVIEGLSIEDLKNDVNLKWILNNTEVAGATDVTWIVAGKPGDKVSVDLISKVDGRRSRYQIGIIVKVEIERSGATLSANLLGFPVESGSLTFQWYRNGAAVTGATEATYTIGTSDYGCKLSVKVSPKSASGYTGTISSDPFQVEQEKPKGPDNGAAPPAGGGGTPEAQKEEVKKEAKDGRAQITADELKKAGKLTVNAEVDNGQVLSVEFDDAAIGAIGTEGPLTIEVNEVTAGGNFTIQNGSVKRAFDINAFAGENKISHFGEGTLTIFLPYVPDKGEDIGGISVYHIDDNGTATKLTATYDAERGGFIVTVNHLSVYALVSETIRFDDVDLNGWSAEYIYYLANLNIVGGVGGNRFAPKRNITRAEFVKMLASTVGADVAAYTGSSFADVKAESWYVPFIEWAFRNGVTTGKGEGTFKPDDMITRQEIAAMIYRCMTVLGLELPETAEAVSFTDEEEIAPYATEAIAALQKAGIIGGIENPDGTFRYAPKELTTREQASKMLAILHRLLFA